MLRLACQGRIRFIFHLTSSVTIVVVPGFFFGQFCLIELISFQRVQSSDGQSSRNFVFRSELSEWNANIESGATTDRFDSCRSLHRLFLLMNTSSETNSFVCNFYSAFYCIILPV